MARYAPLSRRLLLILIAFIQALLLAPAGCTPPPPKPAMPAFSDAALADARKTFARIDERNRTIKQSPEWIGRAYQSLAIRPYRSLDAAAREQLKPYVRDNEVYIIVHPAYYTFFMHDYQEPPLLADDPSPFPLLNLPDRLRLALPQDLVNYRVMWEQERLIRDFLEYMSVKKRLVLLVLPRDFRHSTVYRSPRELDEYARFLNEVTNMSDSILYLESRTWDTGSIDADEAKALHAFLSSLGVTKVLLGGGYVGKCLDNFYESLRREYAYSDISFVPELTSISPRDMVAEKLKFLTNEGRLNMRAVRRYFDKAGFTTASAEEKMPLKSFTLYPVYQVR